MTYEQIVDATRVAAWNELDQPFDQILDEEFLSAEKIFVGSIETDAGELVISALGLYMGGPPHENFGHVLLGIANRTHPSMKPDPDTGRSKPYVEFENIYLGDPRRVALPSRLPVGERRPGFDAKTQRSLYPLNETFKAGREIGSVTLLGFGKGEDNRPIFSEVLLNGAQVTRLGSPAAQKQTASPQKKQTTRKKTPRKK